VSKSMSVWQRFPNVCPLCGVATVWGCNGRLAPKSDILTIQHWPDGSWTFICHRCNVRDGAIKRWNRRS